MSLAILYWLIPIGSRNSSRRISPGCIGLSLLAVIDPLSGSQRSQCRRHHPTANENRSARTVQCDACSEALCWAPRLSRWTGQVRPLAEGGAVVDSRVRPRRQEPDEQKEPRQ